MSAQAITFRGLPLPSETGRLIVLGACLGLIDAAWCGQKPSVECLANWYSRQPGAVPT